MISRKTAMVIANAYTGKFSSSVSSGYGTKETLYKNGLYDYLYEHEYQSWFCNASKKPSSIRGLKEWFLKIHTGETLYDATLNWSWNKRQTLGQGYLKNLARDILMYYEKHFADSFSGKFYKELYDELLRRLEIDGYVFRDSQLYQPDSDVLNIEEEINLLESLHTSLGLSDHDTTFEFFKFSEEHYIAGKWSDSISNTRKFLEAILQQIASRYSVHKGLSVKNRSLPRAVDVRNSLENEGLLEKKEREAIDKIYGLLSHTGSHPYMAEKDQARLLRQISLTFTQFVMLRLEGALTN